jgi:hypothetical protein
MSGAALAIEVVPIMGQHPRDVCRQACLLAHQLNVLVEVTMNGVLLVAGVFEKGEDLHAEYLKKIEARTRDEPRLMVLVDGREHTLQGDDTIARAMAITEAALRSGSSEVSLTRYPTTDKEKP